MIKKIILLGWELGFVFRHRWESEVDEIYKFEWNQLALGIWYKRYKVIKKPNHGQAILGERAKLVTQHMLGMNLLVCKFWFTICYRPFILGYEKNK